MLPEEWNGLGRTRRRLAIYYLRYKRFEYFMDRIPGSVRLTILHSLATMCTLLFLPPAHETPPLAIPIVWGASWGTAIIIYSVTPLLKYI